MLADIVRCCYVTAKDDGSKALSQQLLDMREEQRKLWVVRLPGQPLGLRYESAQPGVAGIDSGLDVVIRQVVRRAVEHTVLEFFKNFSFDPHARPQRLHGCTGAAGDAAHEGEGSPKR